MPHGTHDTAIGPWCRNDSFYIRSVDRCSGDTAAGGFLAQAEGSVCGDLGATKDGLEGEAHGEFEPGTEEAKEIPHGGVEEGVD